MSFVDLMNNGSSLNDLNQTPPLYNFPSSQSLASGSTYEETYTADAEIDEMTPLNIDESTQSVPSRKKPKKSSARSSNFTTEEDKLLVSAWLNVSLDPIKGSDQKKGQFWKRVTQYFEANKRWEGDRSEKSLTSRWATISTSVSKFSGHYNQVQHLRRSGSTEDDKLVEAKEIFKRVEGSAFQLEHCWIIMRFQQKWMDEHQRIDSKRKCKVSSSKNKESINLEEDEDEVPEPPSLKRPCGRKAAQEVAKKAKYTQKVGESENEASETRIELEELRARRLESDRMKSEHFKLLIASEQKQAALREKEYELQIMSMDIGKCSPIQAEYFIALQKEILAKIGSKSVSD